MENDKIVRIVQLVVIILFAVSVGLNVWLLTKENQYKIVEKVTTREVRDTIHDTVPELKYRNLICFKHDTLTVVEKIPGDTTHVVAEVPIEQKVYSNDSTYTAWVSGYRPNLDSIDIYRKTVYIEREITKTKKQHFVVGPYVGYGYDFANKTHGPVVGVGVTYNLFGF